MSAQNLVRPDDLPKWLTKPFLQNILRNHFVNEAIVVHHFAAKLAVDEGENYSSILLRVCVQYETAANSKAEIKLIVKATLPKENEVGAFIGDFDCFNIEVKAYNEILPRIHALLRSIGDEALLAPKCLAADKRDGYLIFEDLSDDAYYMVDRYSGIDRQHFQPLLSQLAKWHATTLYILDKEPLLGKQFNPARCDANSPWRLFVENSIPTLAEYCHQLPQFAHIGQKLKGRAAEIYERISAKCIVTPDGFGGLCHGDMWSNNILFRKACPDGNGAMDAKLIDFQHVFNGAPCFDLLRILYGNSTADLDVGDWDELLQYYHSVYAGTLKKLGFAEHRIPSLLRLHVQMLQLAECEAYMILFVIPFRHLASVKDDPVVHMFHDDAYARQFRMGLLKTESCTASVHKMLTYFDRKGVFD